MASLRHRRLDLELRHTFRLARGATDVRSNLVVELEEDGLVGLGEAAALAHYGQDWRSAAAAHLSPLVDWADLDGNLLVANDPFVGVTVESGRLVLPEEPGLGVVPASGRATDRA